MDLTIFEGINFTMVKENKVQIEVENLGLRNLFLLYFSAISDWFSAVSAFDCFSFYCFSFR